MSDDGTIARAQLAATTTPSPPPPGGFCEECGHFAARHFGAECQWPERPCDCKGMLWLGQRWTVRAQGEPVLAGGAQ